MPGRMTSHSGQSRVVNVFLFFAVLIGGFVAWVVGPAYIEFFAIKKGVRIACNKAYASRSTDTVRDSIMQTWKEESPQEEIVQDDGAVVKRPVPFGRMQNMDVEIRDNPPEVSVSLHYTQHVVFPFINKERELEMEYEHTEDLKQIKW